MPVPSTTQYTILLKPESNESNRATLSVFKLPVRMLNLEASTSFNASKRPLCDLACKDLKVHHEACDIRSLHLDRYYWAFRNSLATCPKSSDTGRRVEDERCCSRISSRVPALKDASASEILGLAFAIGRD